VARGFLSVIFYVSAGFSFSFAAFGTSTALIVVVVLTAILTKFLGGFLFHLFNGPGWREALVLGLGMNARGSLDIAIALLALRLGLITPDVYTALISAIILGTLIVPALLAWGTDWLARRGELLSVEGTPVPRTARARASGVPKVTL
jgi:Kef-type K+ transport system membrane component KefB